MTSTTVDMAQAGEPRELEHGMGHIVPLRTLGLTFAALIGLTLITVSVSTLGLGSWEIWMTLGIATIKGTLVAMYFMHLRYDHPFHALLAIFCLGFVMLFLGLTILDSQGYQADIDAFVEKP